MTTSNEVSNGVEKAGENSSQAAAALVEWKSDLPADFDFTKYPTVNDRYFAKKFYRPPKSVVALKSARCWATTCVLLHSNGVCILCLSPSDPLISDPNLTITEIDFQTGPKTNRLETKPIGKSKKFAQIIKTEDELLCKLIISDGTERFIAAGVRGRLIEVNEQLIDNPKLIQSLPTSNGYIAVIMPPRKNYSFTPEHRLQDNFDEDGVKEEQSCSDKKD